MRFSIWKFIRIVWAHWREKSIERQIASRQAELDSIRWRNSLSERTQKADLASGYNINHFNTMQ